MSKQNEPNYDALNDNDGITQLTDNDLDAVTHAYSVLGKAKCLLNVMADLGSSDEEPNFRLKTINVGYLSDTAAT